MAHVPEKTPPPPFPTPPKPNQPKLFLANYLFLIKQNKSKQQTTSKHINTSFIMFHKSKKKSYRHFCTWSKVVLDTNHGHVISRILHTF